MAKNFQTLELDAEIPMEEFTQLVEKIRPPVDDEDTFSTRVYSMTQSDEGLLTKKSFTDCMKDLKLTTEGTMEEKVGALIKYLEHESPTARIKQMIEETDKDSDGEISLYEMPGVLSLLKFNGSREDIFEVFQSLDEDSSGKVSLLELQTFLWDHWVENKSTTEPSELLKDSFSAFLKMKEDEKEEKETNLTSDDFPAIKAAFEKCFDRNKEDQNWQYFQTYVKGWDPKWIAKVCELWELEKDEDEDDWATDVVDELESSVIDLVEKVEHTMDIFGEGNGTLSVKSVAKMIEFLGLAKSAEDVFNSLDTDKSGQIELNELANPILKCAREQQVNSVFKIVRALLDDASVPNVVG